VGKARRVLRRWNSIAFLLSIIKPSIRYNFLLGGLMKRKSRLQKRAAVAYQPAPRNYFWEIKPYGDPYTYRWYEKGADAIEDIDDPYLTGEGNVFLSGRPKGELPPNTFVVSHGTTPETMSSRGIQIPQGSPAHKSLMAALEDKRTEFNLPSKFPKATGTDDQQPAQERPTTSSPAPGGVSGSGQAGQAGSSTSWEEQNRRLEEAGWPAEPSPWSPVPESSGGEYRGVHRDIPAEVKNNAINTIHNAIKNIVNRSDAPIVGGFPKVITVKLSLRKGKVSVNSVESINSRLDRELLEYITAGLNKLSFYDDISFEYDKTFNISSTSATGRYEVIEATRPRPDRPQVGIDTAASLKSGMHKLEKVAAYLIRNNCHEEAYKVYALAKKIKK
jgi:hypothetical protein